MFSNRIYIQTNFAMPFRFWSSFIFIMLLASACESLPIPETVPSTETRAPARPSETFTRVTPLVSFPTLAPASPAIIATPAAARANALPLAQIISPAASAQFSVNQTVAVVAYAASESGIARLELFDDNVAVRAERADANPIAFAAIFAWTPAQIGSHVLRVVAYDANNLASAPDEITVSVTPDARKPVAAILYPTGTPQFEFGAPIQIFGVASDEVGVTQLDLWVDNQMYSYAASQNANGQSILSNVFTWSALAAGSHIFFVRAHDNQDQTTDSAPLRVVVVDNHTPTLSLSLERAFAMINEPITITITALDPGGVQRIELWSAGQISNTVASSNSARQTALTMQFVWLGASAGEFSITARAYNAAGNFKESASQTITVLRPGQSTPTRAPALTLTRTRTPRATITPRLVPPAPPSAQILSPADHFNNAAPLRVSFSGQANAELERVELWGYGQGQSTPQIICAIDARASTLKSAICEWNPTSAGVVYLFAQAIDSYRQIGKSNSISGIINLPAPATPTPTPPSLSGRWNASTPNGTMSATLRQISGALRGEFKSPIEGDGRIAFGVIKPGAITFHVDFVGAGTLTPIASAAFDFECLVDPVVTTLDCTYKDARGRIASAIFQRE
ncbi:MAG: hypothetical protein HY257_00110 [Chloroflexi bacterium]|nr:hypothetical protein [Chloroflexota bacterium]